MSDELTLRFGRPDDPPIEISSAWLIDESNAQWVAGFAHLDDHTVSLDLASVPSGRYWMSASIAKHPVLRFTIDIKGDGERTVSFAGRAPRCASILVHNARQGGETSRRVHAIQIGMAPEHSAVILVAGFDYRTHQGTPTDYSAYARRWRDDLYDGVTDVGSEPNKKLKRAVYDHTVVSIFDFATGDVYEQIRGVKGWHRMYEFMCGTQRPHTANPQTDLELRKSTDSISIVDVYACIDKIGRDAPGSLSQLHFYSHGYSRGPVLLNTDDDVGHKSSARDPGDKDPRYKDFFEVNIKEHWPHLPQAFATGALVKSWGCFTDDYVKDRILAVRHTTSRSEEVEFEGAMISRDSVMMEVDNALYGSYLLALVDNFGLDVWGPAPGTSAQYKRGYMYIDQSEYGVVLRWYEKYFGGRRDVSGYYPYAKLKLPTE